jgi:uncharacterized protein YjiS (DUF1127 family)
MLLERQARTLFTRLEQATRCRRSSSALYRAPLARRFPASVSTGSAPNALSGPIVAATRWLVALLGDGFAQYAETICPNAHRPVAIHRRGSGDNGPSRTETPSLAGNLATLWSAARRWREIRRMRAAWELLDERTLRDIGISRYEIECLAESDLRWRRRDPHC